MSDVKKIIDLLGHDGAIAGLEGSFRTASELYDLASQLGLTVEKKSARFDLVCDIVNVDRRIINETAEELTELSRHELDRIIKERHPSSKELLEILNRLGIEGKKMTRSKLIDFFISEISELGMYQRVSKGHNR